MHGFGRVEVERDEPVFHARWEARVLGMVYQVVGYGWTNIDTFRHGIERTPSRRLPDARLLRTLARVARAHPRRARRARGRARSTRELRRGRTIPPRDAARRHRAKPSTASSARSSRAPRFAVGERVRARTSRARRDTRACPTTSRGGRASSLAYERRTSSRTPTRTAAAKIPSTSTTSASTAPSSGATSPSRARRCRSTSSSRTWSPRHERSTTITTTTTTITTIRSRAGTRFAPRRSNRCWSSAAWSNPSSSTRSSPASSRTSGPERRASSSPAPGSTPRFGRA